MLNMFKKISLLTVIVLLVLSGCSNDLSESSRNLEEAEQMEPLLSVGPSAFDDEDELLTRIGMLKFSEFDPSQIPDSFGTNVAIKEIVEFFRPGPPPQAVELGAVTIVATVRASFLHFGGEPLDDGSAEYAAHFYWLRGLPLNPGGNFDRGAIEERIEEHNGITYYITIWPPWPGSQVDSSGFFISWVQHDQLFRTSFSPNISFEEALAFSYATPVIAWQLDGDAVSVSIQDMEDVTIVALSDGIGRSGMRQEVISNTLYQSFVVGDRLERRAIGEALYLPSGLGRSDDLERIGYRWLIDAATNRYQYVLAPGIYEFRASGATINSELLVRHFEAGEVALITDFTSEVSDPDVTEFTMIVTPDEVYDFTTEPDEPEQITPYILVRIGEELVDKDEILYLSDDRAWALEIEVFPSDDIVTGQPTVIASDPEVIIEEWNGDFSISGSAWSIFEPALITVTVPTVNGDIEKSFYVSFYSVVVR